MTTPSTTTSLSCGSPHPWWKQPGPWLMLGMLASFSSKSVPNVFVGLMMLMGFWRFARAPRLMWTDSLVRTLWLLFACLWLPMLLALPDAINGARAQQTVWPYLRFLGMGLFVISEARRTSFSAPLLYGTFVIMIFWCGDALWQFFAGHDLFGLPGAAGSIYGVFYPEITLGHIAAALSPWYFHALFKLRDRAPWSALLLIPLVMVVLLSQRRAAWIMLAVSLIGYGWVARHQLLSTVRARWHVAACAALLALAGVAAVTTNSQLQTRWQQTIGLFSGDYQTANLATASRFNLWEVALRMFSANWINGIGPRGYRYAYTEFSAPDDIFHADGQTHPHQLVLEVMVETGTLGVLGLVMFCVIGMRFLRTQPRLAQAWPGVLAVCVAAFPLNTHMAFYGSYWACLLWWLIASTLVMLAEPTPDRP